MERGDGAGQLAEMAKRKKRGNLPPEAKRMMMAWFKTNLHHPYPDEETKKKWIAETGLSPGQCYQSLPSSAVFETLLDGQEH
jgi:hypothetical protein